MSYIWQQRLNLLILALSPVIIAFLTGKFLLVFTMAFFAMVFNLAYKIEYEHKKSLEKINTFLKK